MEKLPYKKIFINGFLSGLLYGTWAYIANDIGALQSALTQGSMSFTFTFFVAFYLEIANQKADSFKALVLYCVALITFLVVAQISIHYMINTENILATVTPSFVIGTVYIVLYLLHLNKGKNKMLKVYHGTD